MIESRKLPILDIQELTVAYHQDSVWLEAVRDVYLRIHAGETYGLVGESGSGKTTLTLALIRYLGEKGAIQKGEIFLRDKNLLTLNQTEIRQIWGKQITLVPQNPQSSLNPSMRIGDQLSEVLQHQLGLSQRVASREALLWLEKVHISDPKRVARSYPHQISGGMQQRVMIAMALCTEPQLLILDEPTTNLDVTTQAIILDLIQELITGRETGILYVTHNLGVVAQICDRIAVLYASELIEDASTEELFLQPLHPYTQGLIDSIPHRGETKEHMQLRAISGQIPSLGDIPPGCVFQPRCPIAIETCNIRPPLYPAGEFRLSRCHRWEEIQSKEISAHQPILPAKGGKTPLGDQPLTLNVDDLTVHFPLRRSITEWARRQPAKRVQAVNNVSFDISPGMTLGLVGESGSGKTTIARTIMGLEGKMGGTIDLLGISLPDKLSQRHLKTLRHLQMVFQNPEEALNPHHTIGETLRRPMMRLLGLPKHEADKRVAQLMKSMRLPLDYVGRLPGQLSGGELQRAAIARAFVANPKLLILDEPVSALDVSVQARILNLVEDLQADHGNSLLLISHDLAVVGYLADRIAVVYLGFIMEFAKPTVLFQPPNHPYTEALLSAIPVADPSTKGDPIHLVGDIPNPINLPSGCPFHTRCPRSLGEICSNQIPPWQVDDKSGKRIFCHIPLEDLTAPMKILDTMDSPPS